VAAVMPGLVLGPVAAGADIFLAGFLRAGILAMVKKFISSWRGDKNPSQNRHCDY
jgi:hypothetical protein